MNLLLSIPSPPSGTIHIGPLQLRAYGLMIALGVLAAVWLFGRRLEQKGIGTREDAASISVWAVVAGVLGSRLYHVFTSWDTRFSDNPLTMFKIWEGGLGIPGGLAAGFLVGAWRVRARGLPIAAAASAAAPAVPLAQAIGRWGNWWNQEIFGRPTDLPWALKVDDDVAQRAGYPPGTTFHPTFLYESLGNLAICGGLLLIDRRFTLRPGRLFVMYLAAYALLRFAVESMRVDAANKILGLRVNTWVSGVVFVGAVGFLVIDHLRHRDDPPVELEPDPALDPDEAPSEDPDAVPSTDLSEDTDMSADTDQSADTDLTADTDGDAQDSSDAGHS